MTMHPRDRALASLRSRTRPSNLVVAPAAPGVEAAPSAVSAPDRQALLRRLTDIATGAEVASVAQVRAAVALLDRLPPAPAAGAEEVSPDEMEAALLDELVKLPAHLLMEVLERQRGRPAGG